MPDQPNLTDKQIGGIVAYIKTESAKVAAQNTAPFAKPSRIRPTYLPVSFANNRGFIVAFIGLVILMVFALLGAVEVKAVERRREVRSQKS